jgi:serine/threonine-protein kinase RsbW
MPTELTAIDEARRWAGGHARGAGIDDAAIADLEVAMTEALSNVVRHSYEGLHGEEVELTLEIDAARLALGIHDRGRPFEPDGYRPPDLDEPGEGGYGVFLIEELMDEVSRRPLGDGGSLVELVHYRREQR